MASTPLWKRQARRFSSLPRIINSKSKIGSTRRNSKNTFQPRASLPPTHPANKDRDVILRYIKTQAWDALIRHLELNPQDAKSIFVINDNGYLTSRLPIHEACRYRAPTRVIKALVDSYPDGVRCRDSSSEFLPIHFACRYGSSSEVVKLLLNSYPQSISKHGRHEGTTPHELASRNTYRNKDDVLNILDSFGDSHVPGKHVVERRKSRGPSISDMEVSLISSAAKMVADWEKAQSYHIKNKLQSKEKCPPSREVRRMMSI